MINVWTKYMNHQKIDVNLTKSVDHENDARMRIHDNYVKQVW